uniref:protein-tyrosine-phosphatase n=1 Tax=Trichuris muris TaxID=70415 RepID=A0A5S6QCM8_TRIMR
MDLPSSVNGGATAETPFRKPFASHFVAKIASSYFSSIQSVSTMNLGLLREGFRDVEKKDLWHGVFLKIESCSSEYKLTQKEGKKRENAKLNRYSNIIPHDHSRVILSDNKYINANHVLLRDTSLNLILTQGPLSNTQKEFWQMIWEKKCGTIIMLTRFVENGRSMSHPYLPSVNDATGEGNTLTVGIFEITETEMVHREHFDMRKLIMRSKESNEELVVAHYHLTCWPDFEVPQGTDQFLDVLAELHKQDSMDGSAPTVVHCSAGVGRSGTFAAVYACILKVKRTGELNMIDLPNLIVELRKYRMGLVQTPEQLRYCWKVVLDAVGSSKWRSLLGIPEPEEPDTADGDRADLGDGSVRPPKRRRSGKGNQDVLEVIDSGNGAVKIAEHNLRTTVIIIIIIIILLLLSILFIFELYWGILSNPSP